MNHNNIMREQLINTLADNYMVHGGVTPRMARNIAKIMIDTEIQRQISEGIQERLAQSKARVAMMRSDDGQFNWDV